MTYKLESLCVTFNDIINREFGVPEGKLEAGFEVMVLMLCCRVLHSLKG